MTQDMKSFTLGEPSEEHNMLAWLGLDVRLKAKENNISEDEAARRFFPKRYSVWKAKVEGKKLVPEW